MDHALKTATLFVTTPLMVHKLSGEAYGYWLTAMSVLSIFGWLDLGMSFGTTRFLALAVGANDRQRQAVIYRVAVRHFRFASRLIGVGSVMVFLVMPFIPKMYAGLQEVGLPTVILATIPAGLSMALRFWWRVPQLLLRAWVRYDLLAWASIIRVAVQATSLIILLPRGGGLLLVGVVHALSDVLELSLQNHFAKQLPPLHLEVIVEDESAAKVRKELVSFTRDIVVGSLGDGVRSNVGPQVTSYLIGLPMVPMYTVGMRLISMTEDVVNSLFGGSLLSIFGQLHGGAETKRLHKEFANVMTITAGFGAAAVGGLLFIGKAFMVRWLGSKFEGAYEVMKVLAVPYALFFMQYPAHSLLHTLGWQRALMWLRCCSGVFAGVAAIGFGLAWGFKGVVWGPAVEMGLLYSIAFPILMTRATGIPLLEYGWNHLLWPGIRGLALPGLVGWLMKDWITPDYTRIAICSAVYALAMVLSVPLCLLNAEGRQRLLAALGRQK